MKINKIGIILGFLIIGGMFTFVMSIDTETMCSPPKVSDTITDVERSVVSTDYDGFIFCTWIEPHNEVYDKNG